MDPSLVCFQGPFELWNSVVRFFEFVLSIARGEDAIEQLYIFIPKDFNVQVIRQGINWSNCTYNQQQKVIMVLKYSPIHHRNKQTESEVPWFLKKLSSTWSNCCKQALPVLPWLPLEDLLLFLSPSQQQNEHFTLRLYNNAMFAWRIDPFKRNDL